jgi:arylsulfatase A-like enzyme
LSGYTVSEYEGGTRVPFIVKEPATGGVSSSSSSVAGTTLQQQFQVIKAFPYVDDVSPTILDYAGVQPAGSTYKGHPVHPIMGKSLRSLFDGTSDKVYGPNDMVSDEMFNNTAVYTGSD